MRLNHTHFLFFILWILPISSMNLIGHTVLTTHAHLEELETALPNQAVIESVTYDADVQLAQSEFNYLMDIKPGQSSTGQKIKKGIAHLYKKNKYEAIAVTISETERGLIVHLTITSLWTFKKLKLRRHAHEQRILSPILHDGVGRTF